MPPVHIGHWRGVYVPTDIYARYLRMKGERVLMIGGSDEHGVPHHAPGQTEGVTPQDGRPLSRYHQKSFEEFGISFDIYSRTRRRFIARPLRNFSVRFMTRGIYRKTSEQYYDEGGEAVLGRPLHHGYLSALRKRKRRMATNVKRVVLR